MKSFVVSIILVLFTATAGLSKEVEGDEAKNIVMKGEVLGMALFDDFFKRVFEEKKSGFIYSVKYDKEIYYCYNSRKIGWFCESFK
jgi:hypothetical protein